MHLDHGKYRHLAGLGMAAGAVLLVIGIRFILVPDSALRAFGLSRQLALFELAAIIGLRDIWLAGLAFAFAWLRQWLALALWLGLGVGVCLADGLIVATTSGNAWAVAFHWGSGLFCAVLALACWRAARATH
jgi:hypothetical protein